jgi:dTDP-glucose 4,6-dehydratase
MENRRIAVIGSNSFSGSDFVDLLLEDPRNEVVGISRSPEKSEVFLSYKRHIGGNGKNRYAFRQLDLNKDIPGIVSLLDEFKPEYIVNFAAQSEVAPSWENPDHWFLTNAVALTRLVNHLKDKKWLKRYVHISSPEVYGTCEGFITESAPVNPSTPYAASKAAGDLSLFTYFKNFQFPMVTIRATNVYGPHQQLFKIIPRSIINLKTGRIIQLHGGGKAVKSYIHIRDVSRGELAAMETGRPGEIYHLSPDRGYEVREVVETICRRLGKDFAKPTAAVAERLGQDKAYTIDSSKARKEFGWAPKIALDQGIAQTVSWVEKYWDEIQRQPLDYVHKA